MSQYLLVDGHSVIFQWDELCKLHSRNTRMARELLAKKLEVLHDSGKWRVTLVFDGKGLSQPPAESGRMLVLYSEEGQTADSVIEKIVGQQQDRANITVVTADEAEKLTIETLGAHVTSPEWLASEISLGKEDIEARIRQIHKQAEW